MTGLATMAVPAEAAAVYDAEDRAADAAGLRRYRRFTEIEAHVEAVTTSDWWDTTFPDAPIDVLVQRRSRNATFSAACRHLNDSASVFIIDGRHWSAGVVLHELAHVAVGTDADHGPLFRAALLELWRREAGVQAWAVLLGELRSAGFHVD